ncbi:hypothetical protein GCM10010112_59730 [Actinoplanes lobatus]|nr:hypothetical protein GCM10010112_59730 [Actinoplanes lobatus]
MAQPGDDPAAGNRGEWRQPGGDGDGEFPGNTEFFNEAGQGLAEIFQRGLLGVAFAVCSQARA